MRLSIDDFDGNGPVQHGATQRNWALTGLDLPQYATNAYRPGEPVVSKILSELAQITSDRDSDACNAAFSLFTRYAEEENPPNPYAYHLLPVALDLIDRVVVHENSTGRTFHKGKLYFETAILFYAVCNFSRFGFYLSMALREDSLSKIDSGKAGFAFYIGKRHSLVMLLLAKLHVFLDSPKRLWPNIPVVPEATRDGVAAWFSSLKTPQQQFELTRICEETNELATFVSENSGLDPERLPVPLGFRFGKLVCHLAQWVEDYLYQEGYDQQSVYWKTRAMLCEWDKAHADTCEDNFENANGNYQSIFYLMALKYFACDDCFSRLLSLAYLHRLRNETAHRIDSTMEIYTSKDKALDALGGLMYAVYAIDMFREKDSWCGQ